MSRLEHGDDATGVGVKIVVEYRDITRDWLNSISGLDLISKTMEHKKLLQGIFDRRTKVVLKIADNTEDIEKEWNIYKKLDEIKIPNKIKYHCFFRCADTISKYVRPQESVCEGKGESLQVLVMEYLNSKSFKNFNWSNVPIEVFHSCVTQALLFALYAFEKIGFTHGDFHLDNILMCRTQKREIIYDDINIPLYGWQIKFLDFEWSKTNQTEARFLFRDVLTFVNKLHNLVDYFDIVQIQKMYDLLNQWIRNNETNPRKLLDLIPICNKIRSKNSSGGGLGLKARPRPHQVYFGRKIV